MIMLPKVLLVSALGVALVSTVAGLPHRNPVSLKSTKLPEERQVVIAESAEGQAPTRLPAASIAAQAVNGERDTQVGWPVDPRFAAVCVASACDLSAVFRMRH